MKKFLCGVMLTTLVCTGISNIPKNFSDQSIEYPPPLNIPSSNDQTK